MVERVLEEKQRTAAWRVSAAGVLSQYVIRGGAMDA